MEIKVHGKSSHVPENLQKFATEKLQHLAKFLSTIQTIDVEIYEEGKPKDGNGHVAHVTVSTSGPIFRSKVVSDDPHVCIDKAATRLERSIKEFKRKRSGKPPHARPAGTKARVIEADDEED